MRLNAVSEDDTGGLDAPSTIRQRRPYDDGDSIKDTLHIMARATVPLDAESTMMSLSKLFTQRGKRDNEEFVAGMNVYIPYEKTRVTWHKVMTTKDETMFKAPEQIATYLAMRSHRPTVL